MKPTHFLWGFTPKANKLVLWCSFNIYQQGLRGNANQSIPDPLFWWRGENLYGVFHLMSTTAFSQLVLFCGVSDSMIIFQGTLPVEFLSNIPRSTNKQIHICKFQPKHKNSSEIPRMRKPVISWWHEGLFGLTKKIGWTWICP